MNSSFDRLRAEQRVAGARPALSSAESYLSSDSQDSLYRPAAQRILDRAVDIGEVVVGDERLHRQPAATPVTDQGRDEFVPGRVALDAAAHGAPELDADHVERHLGTGSGAADQAAHAERREAVHRLPQRARGAPPPRRANRHPPPRPPPPRGPPPPPPHPPPPPPPPPPPARAGGGGGGWPPPAGRRATR